MTIEEVRREMVRRMEWCSIHNRDRVEAYEWAIRLIDQLTPDTTADEMMEWANKEFNRGFSEWQNKVAWDRYAIKFWEGYWWSLKKMMEEFGEGLPWPDSWQEYLRFVKEMNHG